MDEKERAFNAAQRYIELKGGVVEGDANIGEDSFLVFTDEKDLVFAHILVSHDSLMETDKAELRRIFEQAAARWLSRNDVVDIILRCDEIAFLVVGESKALLRHHINAIGGEFDE